MPRKPAILIALILLIAGGGVAFYHHLRKLPPTGSSDLLHILFSGPTVVGWQVEQIPPHKSYTHEKEGWWSLLGFRRTVTRFENNYKLTHPKTNAPCVMTVETEGEKIVGIRISGDGQFEEEFYDVHRQFRQFHYFRFH